MENDLNNLLKLIEEERGIPYTELVEILETATLDAYLRHVRELEGIPAEDQVTARAVFEARNGTVTIYRTRFDESGLPLAEEADSPDDFGRVAAQAARHALNQKLRQLRDDAELGMFRDRTHTLVTGVVQSVDERTKDLKIMVDGVIVTMPEADQVKTEQYGPGDRITVFVLKVEKTPKGPLVTVSRTKDDLVKKLFAREVPEIADRRVEIVSVAREPGYRTKIAVKANDPTINAKGAAIGELGQRVRAVTAELNGEKIDIIDYSDDLLRFVANALSPAKATEAFYLDQNSRPKVVRVLVPDYQLSLAIGKDGQNSRLAAKLTETKVDVQPDSVMHDDEEQ